MVKSMLGTDIIAKIASCAEMSIMSSYTSIIITLLMIINNLFPT